jgi:integrase
MTPGKSKGSAQLSDLKDTKKSRNEKDFANILQKCTSKGWSNVIDFLRDKATNSLKTAVGYWTGIKHLNDFVEKQYSNEYDVQTVIEPLKQERIDIYDLMRLFKLYLMHDAPNHEIMAIGSVINYIKYAKSYFMFSDIDIIDHKFRARVKMPQLHKEDEQAIDAEDIIEILHHTDNRRLKAYILVLASTGCRAVEALAIREMDIDWSGIDFNSHDAKDMRASKRKDKKRIHQNEKS